MGEDRGLCRPGKSISTQARVHWRRGVCGQSVVTGLEGSRRPTWTVLPGHVLACQTKQQGFTLYTMHGFGTRLSRHANWSRGSHWGEPG